MKISVNFVAFFLTLALFLYRFIHYCHPDSCTSTTDWTWMREREREKTEVIDGNYVQKKLEEWAGKRIWSFCAFIGVLRCILFIHLISELLINCPDPLPMHSLSKKNGIHNMPTKLLIGFWNLFQCRTVKLCICSSHLFLSLSHLIRSERILIVFYEQTANLK